MRGNAASGIRQRNELFLVARDDVEAPFHFLACSMRSLKENEVPPDVALGAKRAPPNSMKCALLRRHDNLVARPEHQPGGSPGKPVPSPHHRHRRVSPHRPHLHRAPVIEPQVEHRACAKRFAPASGAGRAADHHPAGHPFMLEAAAAALAVFSKDGATSSCRPAARARSGDPNRHRAAAQLPARALRMHDAAPAVIRFTSPGESPFRCRANRDA